MRYLDLALLAIVLLIVSSFALRMLHEHQLQRAMLQALTEQARQGSRYTACNQLEYCQEVDGHSLEFCLKHVPPCAEVVIPE